MDQFDAFLYNLHLMIGHDTTARYIGVDAGDKAKCHLCHPSLCDDTCKGAHQPTRKVPT